MHLPFRKLLFTLLFNLSLFFLLIIGIQNSSNKKQINLIFGETISLPVSFTIGMSFICGSITGGVLTVNLKSIKTINSR